MKRTSVNNLNPQQLDEDNIEVSKEEDGNIHVVIKNPFLNANKLKTSELLKLLANKDDSEELSSDEKKLVLDKMQRAEIHCDNCEKPLAIETKLKLEKCLRSDPEDAVFRETVLNRLDKIESMLSTLLAAQNESTIQQPKRRKCTNSSSVSVDPTQLPIITTVMRHANEVPTFIEYLEEEHLDESSTLLEESQTTERKDFSKIEKLFPLKTIKEMDELNERLLDDENFVEDILSYLRHLNFKISNKTAETSKYIQYLITNECLGKYSWESEKPCLTDLVLFSKMVYVTWGKYLAYQDFEVIMKKLIHYVNWINSGGIRGLFGEQKQENS